VVSYAAAMFLIHVIIIVIVSFCEFLYHLAVSKDGWILICCSHIIHQIQNLISGA